MFASLRHRARAQSALCGGDPECVCESLAFEGRKKKNVFRTQFSIHALRAERLLRRTASLHFSLQPRLSYSHQSRGEKLNVRALYGSDLMDYDFNFIPGRCSPPLPLLLKINFSALCARLLMPGTLDCEKWLRGVTQMRRRRLNIECNFLLGKSCVWRGWREKSALCTVISACVALDARKGRSRSLLTLRRGRNLSLRKITAHTRVGIITGSRLLVHRRRVLMLDATRHLKRLKVFLVHFYRFACREPLKARKKSERNSRADSSPRPLRFSLSRSSTFPGG